MLGGGTGLSARESRQDRSGETEACRVATRVDWSVPSRKDAGAICPKDRGPTGTAVNPDRHRRRPPRGALRGRDRARERERTSRPARSAPPSSGAAILVGWRGIRSRRACLPLLIRRQGPTCDHRYRPRPAPRTTRPTRLHGRRRRRTGTTLSRLGTTACPDRNVPSALGVAAVRPPGRGFGPDNRLLLRPRSACRRSLPGLTSRAIAYHLRPSPRTSSALRRWRRF